MTSVESIPPIFLGGVPVVQSSHLESDPTLATEILPGPPSLLSLQQAGNRRDKKPSAALSYLPVSDPGSTYSALAMGAGTTTMMNSSVGDGARRKRARTNKGASPGRPQRTSARIMNPSPLTLTTDMASNGHEAAAAWVVQAQPPQQEFSMPSSSVVDVDEPMLSRSNSEDEIQFLSAHINGTNGKERSVAGRRDKGKGKEKEKPLPAVRVKEEPMAISLNLNDYGSLSNEDHCSSCQSVGSLVYCDGCPKSFHLWCLDPPMEPQDVPEGENRWFCPACVIHNDSPPKPSASLKFMAPLIQQLHYTIPMEFRLPEELRTAFRDVATGPRGTYVDSSEIKPPRLNRHGQLEDRDPYRLKDRNGDPILCFQCGLSALPDIAVPPMKRPRRASNKLASMETWQSIISCDYCDLSWHLDCLDPPAVNMPAFGIKWMCPNHAEQVHKPKRRIPKHGAAPIEITKPNEWNNGNIEIIPNDTLTPQEKKLLVDEISINGRRYRVPERVIKLDFWNKVNGTQPPAESRHESPLSSPLTSLSSLDDFDDPPTVASQSTVLYSMDDIVAAQVLWTLQARNPRIEPLKSIFSPQAVNGTLRGTSSNNNRSVSPQRQSSTSSQICPKTKTESHRSTRSTISPDPIHPAAVATPYAAQLTVPREPSPPAEGTGRRRSARKPVPRAKLKVDMYDDTSSDCLSSSTASQPPPKVAKPKVVPSTSKSHPLLLKPTPSATSKAKLETSSTATKPVNGNSKPSKAVAPSNHHPTSVALVPKNAKTPGKVGKAGKPVPSTVTTPAKPEPNASPTPTATSSLRIRLPRLSDITSTAAPNSTPTAPSRTNPTGETVRGTRARRMSKKQASSAS